mmetsp:Transcript_65279/g.194631  ORF Transcript_65279/g.194631 Transcript_65279/m.194631 type:complete len:240 (-) Transcript_65279:381-1100(-)
MPLAGPNLRTTMRSSGASAAATTRARASPPTTSLAPAALSRQLPRRVSARRRSRPGRCLWRTQSQAPGRRRRMVRRRGLQSAFEAGPLSPLPKGEPPKPRRRAAAPRRRPPLAPAPAGSDPTPCAVQWWGPAAAASRPRPLCAAPRLRRLEARGWRPWRRPRTAAARPPLRRQSTPRPPLCRSRRARRWTAAQPPVLRCRTPAQPSFRRCRSRRRRTPMASRRCQAVLRVPRARAPRAP